VDSQKEKKKKWWIFPPQNGCSSSMIRMTLTRTEYSCDIHNNATLDCTWKHTASPQRRLSTEPLNRL